MRWSQLAREDCPPLAGVSGGWFFFFLGTCLGPFARFLTCPPVFSQHVGLMLRRDGPLAGKGFDPDAAADVLAALHSVRVLVM